MRIKGIGRSIAHYAANGGYATDKYHHSESRKQARTRAWEKRTSRRALRRDASAVLGEGLEEYLADCELEAWLATYGDLFLG
jgi:hypothetical protein